MQGEIASFYRRKEPHVLNRVLYAQLVERFGRVEIAAHREAAIPGPPRLNFRTRKFEAGFAHLGEYYRVNCPYCNDTRFRLYVNHLWCTPSPVDGEPLWHLATCYNENCLATKYRDFHTRVWGWRNASTRRALALMRVEQGIIVDRPMGAAPLPGRCTPVDRLPRDHPAVCYLEDRGYDVGELASTWEVAFCDRAEGIYATAGRRLIVPIVHEEVRVGWQARHVGELDWKRTGIPKYYTLSHFRTGKTLYNLDLARQHRIVVACEGVADVWAVGDAGVALFGKTIGRNQEELLAGWVERGGLVVLMLDPDAREQDPERHDLRMAELKRRLDRQVVEVALPPGKDPGQYDRRALWRLIKGQVRAAGFDPKRYD